MRRAANNAFAVYLKCTSTEESRISARPQLGITDTCAIRCVCFIEGMRLEQQVVSLELAKQLKDLGAEQASEFACYETTDRDDTPRLNWFDESRMLLPPQRWEVKYAAFTVAELGEMLDLNQKYPNVGKSETGDWFVNFTRHHYGGSFVKEADARAAILVYLLEQDLTQVPAA